MDTYMKYYSDRETKKVSYCIKYYRPYPEKYNEKEFSIMGRLNIFTLGWLWITQDSLLITYVLKLTGNVKELWFFSILRGKKKVQKDFTKGSDY